MLLYNKNKGDGEVKEKKVLGSAAGAAGRRYVVFFEVCWSI